MTDNTDTLAERDEIETLLPWYATGRLDSDDADRVAAGLERYPDLRARLERIHAERERSAESNVAIVVPPQDAAADRLIADVRRRRRAAQPVNGNGLLSLLRGAFASPVAMRWAMAAAVLVVVAQTAVIVSLVATSDVGEYRAATGQPAAVAPGSVVLVRFSGTATAPAIADLLAEHDMTIVDGPRADGFFTVRIGSATMSDADRQRRIGLLRQRADLIAFVTVGR